MDNLEIARWLVNGIGIAGLALSVGAVIEYFWHRNDEPEDDGNDHPSHRVVSRRRKPGMAAR